MSPGDRWLDEIPLRTLLEDGLEARFAMSPGDRALVDVGATVVPGDPLLERLRDRRIDEVSNPAVGTAAASAEPEAATHPDADAAEPEAEPGSGAARPEADPAEPAAEPEAEPQPAADSTTAGEDAAPEDAAPEDAADPFVEPALAAVDPAAVAIDQAVVTAQPVAIAAEPIAGARLVPRSSRRRRDPGSEGELVSLVPGQRDRWRIATGDQRDTVVSPIAGTVVDIRPGGELCVRPVGRSLRGVFAAGSPARGRLELATDPFGDLRPGGIDVGRAGSILVVGARIDAEALTRARAMGVRGIIVASLPGKDLRDFRASERRQRASLHQAAAFGVLVLDGTARRPIPTPIAGLLERLSGREVTLLIDPPALVFDEVDVQGPVVDADWVRVRSGPDAGTEGRLVGPAGIRSFARGILLESAFVAVEGRPPIAIPMGDLERLA